MSIVTKMRRQTAIYWPPSGRNPDGSLTWGDPRLLSCRWSLDAKSYVGSDGEEHVSTAVAYVGEDLELDGAMKEGAILPTSHPRDPQWNGALIIKQVGKTPNLKATEFLRTVYL